MTLRFDWYSRLSHEVINTKASVVLDLIVKETDRKATKLNTELSTKQILSALYHSYFSFPKGSSKVSISLTSGHYTKTKYPYRIIKDVFDCLCDLKWIEFEKGSENKKRVTRIWAVGELSLAFDAMGLLWFSQEPKPEQSLVVLRDYRNPEGETKKARGSKVDLEVPETPEVKKYRSNLFNYNEFLLKHCIWLDLDDENLSQLAEEIVKRSEDKTRAWSTEEDEKVGCLDFSRVQLRRIFSRGSLEKGGRFYGGWWQSIPSLYRPHIKIDTYPTVEKDYSSMALRIIYALEGIDVAEDIDLYDIGLPDWQPEKDPRRKPVKTYINAVLNDEFGNYRLKKHDQDITGIMHKELHEMVLERHKPIAHLFNTGIGLEAQFIDSQIAEEVLMAMMYQEIPVLPIHDSFIVRTGYAFLLHEEMNKAFEKIVKASVGITTDTTRTNEHFGLHDEEFKEVAGKSRIVKLGSDESWEDFKKYMEQPMIMDRYIGSWRQRDV